MRSPRFDLIGLRTLFLKEVRRFSKIWIQTVVSPLTTTSLYFLVFGVALGSRLRSIEGVPYVEFVIPGLMMLSMINNAYANTSSSFFQSRMNGTIVDLLVAPLGAGEILTAYVAAAMARALLVGGLVFAVATLFTGLHVHSLLWTLFFAVAVSASFALVGLLMAIGAERFDHLSAVPSFVLTPLTFLGGVFYSVDMLPEPWASVSRLNPILYMVNGLRYGLLGISDVAPEQSALGVGALLLVLVAGAAWALAKGAKLRR